MARNLHNKTALITGAAKRIGRETALALAREGVNVIVHYRSSMEEADSLVDELRGLGVNSWSIQADFTVVDEVETLPERAFELAGPVNMLVNNASAFPVSSFESLTFDELVASIRIDAWTPFELGRRFARITGAEHIVNLLDTRIAADYDWTHVGYFAAKYLLGMFTRMMAVRLAPGIAVNAVAPGLILPPEGKGVDYLESLKGDLPLKRVGDPEQVAEAVVYLLKSEFITGQVIYVDGGRHLREVGRG